MLITTSERPTRIQIHTQTEQQSHYSRVDIYEAPHSNLTQHNKDERNHERQERREPDWNDVFAKRVCEFRVYNFPIREIDWEKTVGRGTEVVDAESKCYVK